MGPGEKRRQEYLKMMRDPYTWVNWPILPMKRVGRYDPPMTGFLLATGQPKLYLKNFLELHELGINTINEVDKKIESKEYNSFESILDDGWTVD